MEKNKRKSRVSSRKRVQLQFTTMPMAKCCISGCPAITDSFISFPPKTTEEYTLWLRTCKESEENIIFKQNPMICVLHFRSMDRIPIRYVTKKDIDTLNADLVRVNHYVAEWLLLLRRDAPVIFIEDDDVYKKAKEIGRVYQLPYFEFHGDFGWLKMFENYLRSRCIEGWNPKPNTLKDDDSEPFQSEESTVENSTEKSIKTYDEALKRVQMLYRYCKRTKNKSALQVIERLNIALNQRV